MLEVGNFGFEVSSSSSQNALAFAESCTHFGAWCVSSSPLVLGLDATDTDRLAAVWPVLSNTEAIDVNQQWAGHPGTLAKGDATFQLWTKPLPGGNTAALLFNKGTEILNVSVSLQTDLGLARVGGARDIWRHQDVTLDGDVWEVALAAHDSEFLVFFPAATDPGAPNSLPPLARGSEASL